MGDAESQYPPRAIFQELSLFICKGPLQVSALLTDQHHSLSSQDHGGATYWTLLVMVCSAASQPWGSNTSPPDPIFQELTLGEPLQDFGLPGVSEGGKGGSVTPVRRSMGAKWDLEVWMDGVL